MGDPPRHTCLRLQLSEEEKEVDTIYVKGTWFLTHFNLFITDGSRAWICNAPEVEVKERAEQWDQQVSDYVETAERYLGFQQPDSLYRFADAGDGFRRLSWTFEKQGTKLEWRWKCQPSSNNKQSVNEILDFLMDANIRLSEEVVMKTQLCNRLKVEAEKCLAQSERFNNEKKEFESATYAKFVAVLNSKKAKLRELRDLLSKNETNQRSPQEDESTDRTEIMEGSDEEESTGGEPLKDIPSTSKISPAGRGQKRKTQK